MVNFKERHPSDDITVHTTLEGLRLIRAWSTIKSVDKKSLKDAEDLANAGADYIFDLMENRKNSNQRKHWLAQVEQTENRYGRIDLPGFFDGKRASFTDYFEGCFEFIKSYSNNRDFDLSVILHLDSNGLSPQDLYDRRLLVLSPLSSDYLIASFIQKCVRQFLSPQCFSLKPIILNMRRARETKPLKVLAVPDFRDPEFSEVERVGLFLDSYGSCRTLCAGKRAVTEFQKDLRSRLA